MKNAVVIRHVAFEDLGSLAIALHQKNYDVNYIDIASDSLKNFDPLAPDLLIVLGGPIGVYEEVDYPFLAAEIQVLERRLAADRPTIGICLGAQLMARALGARVYPGQEKEIGWSPIELSTAGQHSILSYLAPDYMVLHWHGDTFDLPKGSVRLASSYKYENQAFAWGECGLALQFHPEVTASGLENWFIGHAHEISNTPGISVNQLRADTANYIKKLSVQSAKFWQAWLEKLEGKKLFSLANESVDFQHYQEAR